MGLNTKVGLMVAMGLLLSHPLLAKDYLIFTSETSL